MNLASWGEGKRETLILAYNEMKKLIFEKWHWNLGPQRLIENFVKEF